MKGWYLFIVTTKEYYIEKYSNVFVIKILPQQLDNDGMGRNYSPSGIICTLYVKLERWKDTSNLSWGRLYYENVSKLKANIVNKNNYHFGSIDYHYSFGNKVNFDIIGFIRC